MLTPYFGEFLIIPMPLELSLERCSNACHYCFSNLGGYTMQGSIQSVFNHIANFQTRKDLASQLLRQGYPICFSNRSDPFCKSNAYNAVKLCEIMCELEIDIAFQTKTGPGVDDVLEFLPPSCWYVSISFDDDALCKRIEPGAPVASKRLFAVEKIVSKGHTVDVGINPYVPKWVKNKRSLLQSIKDSGAYGVFVEGLHMSAEQKRRLIPGVIDADVLKKTEAKIADMEDLAHYEELVSIALELDLEVFSFWNDRPTDFWKPYQTRYKCFPIITDFINYCYRNKKKYDIIDFNEFKTIMTGLPPGKFKIDSYAISINRSFKNKNIPVMGCAEDLLKLFWSTPDFPVCPAKHPTLSIVAEYDPDYDIYEIDSGLPRLMFNPDNWHSNFININGEEI